MEMQVQQCDGLENSWKPEIFDNWGPGRIKFTFHATEEHLHQILLIPKSEYTVGNGINFFLHVVPLQISYEVVSVYAHQTVAIIK